jgi:hypothetical protein
MQKQVSNVMKHEVSTVVSETPVRRKVEEVLRRRMWIRPEQVQVRVEQGAATLTGAVDRRSTAGIAVRLATAVPGVTHVVGRIRYDFDDTDLVRSKVNRTHPFSADPFPPGRQTRRISTRLRDRGRRGPRRNAPAR